MKSSPTKRLHLTAVRATQSAFWENLIIWFAANLPSQRRQVSRDVGQHSAMTAILANVGVPLFFPQPLLALVALLPIVAVEALILRRAGKVRLRDIFIANVFSAIWGVPLAFISVLVLGYSTGVTLDRNYSSLLEVALVMLVLVVPCWALSVYLEGWYLRPRFSGVKGRSFWLVVARAQCYSYLVLLVVYCLWVTIQLSKG